MRVTRYGETILTPLSKSDQRLKHNEFFRNEVGHTPLSNYVHRHEMLRDRPTHYDDYLGGKNSLVQGVGKTNKKGNARILTQLRIRKRR
jgi:hypothetical protein